MAERRASIVLSKSREKHVKQMQLEPRVRHPIGRSNSADPAVRKAHRLFSTFVNV